jgi:hypothetical protein
MKLLCAAIIAASCAVIYYAVSRDYYGGWR